MDLHRASRRMFAALATVGLVLAALLVFFPEASLSRWMSTRLLLAQALAFPALTGGALILLGTVALVLSMTVQSLRRIGVVTAALALAVLGAGLAAFPAGPPWTAGPFAATGNTGRTLRVTVFNSQDTLTASDVRELVDVADPDVLVLPEATPSRAVQAMAGTPYATGIHEAPDAGFSDGRPWWAAPTVMAVRPRAGAYKDTAPTPSTFGALRLEPLSGAAAPVLVGVHTAPPLPRTMDAWRADLNRLGGLDNTTGDGPVILAGDLNATLRHGALTARAHLVDTAQQCTDHVGGTWPAAAPAWARAPIDHVLVSTDIEVLSCSTHLLGSSDHLAYSVELRLPPFPPAKGEG
ncbi:endonuclease/exonuclease/phosphatase family protein [Micrococcus sp.]|uniref:endonuclease/exonuclease/phosphatase family protein n=1 Tax=Micrococcus sp. TaxID=1271 RepID=UPI002A91CC55|nr:endonuclease/exonuclease/phosphatase family protein [Micrococcus sp.]MDY6056167.1 endonuclease/exonuclease/phosphatase family protein [Micrococcus sp.]